MRLLDETVLLSVSLFDRISALCTVPPSELQLTAATCLWIASKMEEQFTPMVADFIYLCSSVYTASDFITCETVILNLLHFSIASTTSIVYAQSCLRDHPDLLPIARFFCFSMLFSNRPCHSSLIGITSVFLASLIRKTEPIQIEYEISVNEVLNCSRQMLALVLEISHIPGHPLYEDFPYCIRRSIQKQRHGLTSQITIANVRRIFRSIQSF
jgi:hypothetical protein